ncbi:class I SAM-dependent methyltransferase [Candidatus Pelagibacter ubique]|nr:class I SAM-dependent methyltransferase [Candidatus Pelagibacter ubique]
MIIKKIDKCRNCKSNKISKVLDLGSQALANKFPKKINERVVVTPLTISICNKCEFVQLLHNFNNIDMYNMGYGYESGINSTMKNHLSALTKKIQKLKELTNKNIVMDIASNDGTLLNSYKGNIIKIGCDPILNRFKKNYKNIDHKISNFFSYKVFSKLNLHKKVDVITASAVFYDIDNPNQFLKDIKKILDISGIFIMEQSNLACMLKSNSFDTICQEHLGYYSTKVIKNMLKKNGLKIFNHEYTTINGGSSRYYITHEENKKMKINIKNINKALKFEAEYKLGKIETYKKFEKKILKIKKLTMNKINKLLSLKKTIHGYGASTKGNVLLQYFNIDNNKIKYIADRNPFKYGKFTPSTKIKIISEKESRKKKPDFYFVLPWHFKKEILIRETKIRKKGTKFIFPLPKLTIN